MKKIFSAPAIIFLSMFSFNCLYAQQNVGIKEDNTPPDPAAKLDIQSTTKGLLIPRMTQLQRQAINPAPQGLIVYQTDALTGLYYNASSLPGIQNWYRLINIGDQYWTKTLSGDHMYTTNTGNVGIGNTFPDDAGLVVDRKIGATNAMFGRNTTGVAIETNFPGIGLNSYYNGGRKTIGTGYTGLIGFNPVNGDLTLFNSSASTAGDATSTVLPRLTADKDGNIGVEGNTNPLMPLSFYSSYGNKISLYGSSVTSNYGFGIQGSLLQMYSSTLGSDIAFGYGSSTNFTENMRIKGNGNVGIGINNPTSKLVINQNGSTAGIEVIQNGSGLGGYFYSTTGNALFAFNSSATQPAAYFVGTNALAAMGNVGIGTGSPVFPLDIKGRTRLRNDGATTPGIWFNKPDESQGSFIGQFDATNFGIWGPGTSGSWKFLFDGSDGTLRIGTTQKGTGYLVNVGGKIIAEEVRVQLRASWPDYVFKKDYKLMPLYDVEKFINTNNHLPGFKKAEVIEKEGTDLGETQRKMIEKIEELTLYIIQQQRDIDLLKQQVKGTSKSIK